MTSLAQNRLVRSERTQAKRRLQPARLHFEELEHRIALSYFPSTANGIHVFEDQLPTGLSNAMVQFIANHIDGTQKEQLSQTQQYRAINPDFTVLHYQLGTGNSPYDYIINNQWSSDWTYVNQQESWFAHQTYSGEPQSASDLASGRVGNSTGWDQADIANTAWQQYTLNQVLQNIAATGSNGWFADSFTYGIGGAGYTGTIPTRYQGTNAANPADWPGGIDWTDQLANWAHAIETAFANYNAANGTDYQFIPNLDARVTSWEPNWYDNASGVPFIDGAFLEGFGEYTDTSDWTFSMNQGLNLTDNGKIVIMQPYPSADPSTAAGQQQVNFYLGTYLLLKGNETYLNIDYNGGVQYYPQYELNLGTAVTPLQSNVSGYLWNGVYRRNFQNGFVLVNPGSTTYTLNLGGTYQLVQGTGGGPMTDADLDANGNYTGGSLSYQAVSSITLAGGSAAIFLNNNLTGSSTTLAASVNPSVHGQSVTFTATVTPNGSGTPTGTVTFENAGVAIGSGALTNGTATFTTSTLATGTDSITAVYSGDSNFSGSTSSALSQTVNKDGSSTTLKSSVEPSVFGQSVTFTASVIAGASGSGTPTGTVTFENGGVAIGSGTLASGTATFTTSTLGVGTHSITAVYGADANFSGSTSSALDQTVNKDGTTIDLATSLNPSVYGQSVTFTATVSPNGSGTPTGTVTFEDGGVTIGSGTLAKGAATFVTTTLAAGAHSVTAIYSGDSNFSGSTSSTLSQTVDQTGSTISGTVFADYNHNGRQDAGEPGLAGQTLFIDVSGTGILAGGDPTATTNAQGDFQFAVAPGTYTIRPVLYGGILLDTPAGGSYQVTVTSGPINSLNFGEVLTNIAVPLTLPITTPFPSQGNANADYVEALYRFILQRNADPTGLAYWTGLLNKGTSRTSVAEAIWKSTEHFTQEVTAYYETILDRPPDSKGLAAWVAVLENGTPEEQVVIGFLDSQEFLSRGDKYFVDQMYTAILGRPVDAAGEADWLAELGDNSSGNPTGQPAALTHEQVIKDILYSTESLTRLIEGNYQIFLARTADSAGLNDWLAALQQGTPFAAVAEGFLASNEFYNAAAANR
jgi:Bacterial Ig-like domain (group 3)/Hypothetical glycosyl hydrolase family 15/Domain of unknown function (DUF4214)/SdrD B-like domain